MSSSVTEKPHSGNKLKDIEGKRIKVQRHLHLLHNHVRNTFSWVYLMEFNLVPQLEVDRGDNTEEKSGWDR